MTLALLMQSFTNVGGSTPPFARMYMAADFGREPHHANTVVSIGRRVLSVIGSTSVVTLVLLYTFAKSRVTLPQQ